MSFLTEGGAVGHLQHLYENRGLTFRDIKTVLRKAATGRLERVSEKMDGQQLTFTYDVSTDRILAARSTGDVRSGGMDAAALATKFAGRGSVEDAFTKAFKVLGGAIGALSSATKEAVFGPAADRWYSMEIIYTKNPNVVNYDSDSIVFHGWPVFSRTPDGKVEMVDDDGGGVDVLTRNIDKMQAAVNETGWRVRGPAIVRMKELSDGTIYEEAIDALDAAMSHAGVGDGDTIGDYLESLLAEDVRSFGLSPEVSRMVVDRVMEVPGAPTLTDIKKKLDKSEVDKVASFVRNSSVALKSYVRPIELAISDFASEVLRGLGSTLIDDTDREIVRLRGEVQRAISAIESSGDEAAMDVLRQQMEKLRNAGNVTSPVEGVVFVYKGNAYKFSGNFAAVNQILGLFKYGRGGTKMIKSRNETSI